MEGGNGQPWQFVMVDICQHYKKYFFASENANLKKEDILVLPLDVLDFNSHESAVDSVLKYFKRVSYILQCYVKKE